MFHSVGRFGRRSSDSAIFSSAPLSGDATPFETPGAFPTSDSVALSFQLNGAGDRFGGALQASHVVSPAAAEAGPAPLALHVDPVAVDPAPAAAASPFFAAASAAQPVTPEPSYATGVTVTATATQSLLTDVDGDGQYDPGDTIQNVLTITNPVTSLGAATTISFTDTLQGSTLVAGSIKVSPIAVDDAGLTLAGNTPITFTAAQLLGNDIDPDGTGNTGLSIVSVTNAQHGTIVNNGNGTFTFTPSTGYTGAASFDYSVQDSQGLTSVVPGTVALTVTGQVWYVDSNASAAGADGSFGHPFNSLTSVNGAGDADGVGDTIVVHGTINANFALEAGQKVYGDGSTLVINGNTVTNGAGTTTFSAASGNVVTLSTDNTIDGITVAGSGTATAIADNGGSVTGTGAGLVVAHLTISGAESGLSVTHGGAVNGTIAALSTTGGVSALNLAGTAASGTGLLSGMLTVTGGAISGDTGTAIKIGSGVANSGGTLSLNYGGNIATTATNNATGIDINNKTGGTVNFTGQTIAINSGTAAGVTLTTNAGATINLNPTTGGNGLDITTSSGNGFVFTGGGTLSVQGSGNTVTTASGHVVDFGNGAIGGSGVTFQNLSATGTVSGTAISLNNVDGGAFAGGAVAVNAVTTDGIAIINGTASAVTFTSAQISAVAANGHGINISGNTTAAGAANVTLGGTVTDSATSTGAQGVYIDNNNGTVAFTGASKAITSTTGDAVHISNNAAAVTFSGGGLVVNATSGTGISATAVSPGGGSLTISGTGNTVTTTSGTGVLVTNVNETITLQKVAVSAGTGDGISLTNAGNGGFAVTGTGTTANSGGAITGVASGADGSTTAGIAVYLNNVGNVQLSNVNIGGTWSNFGIRGDNVTNFGLHDSTVGGTLGTSGAADEGAIRFGTQGTTSGIIGTGVFDGNTISGGYEDNLDLYSYGSTSSNITIKDSVTNQAVFNNTQNPGPSGSGNDNIHVESGNTSNLTLLIDGVNVNGAHGDMLQVVAADSTTQNVTVQNSAFNNTGAGTAANTIGGGVFLGGDGNASAYTTTFNFSGNTVTGAKDTAAAFIYSGQSATVSGIVANNTIGTLAGGTADGSGSKNGNGIEVDAQHYAGTGTVNVAVRIQGNQVYDWANAGIGLASNSGGGGTNRLEATVLGNTVSQGDATFGLAPFYAVVGGQSTTDPSLLGLNISGNTFTAPANAGSDILLDQPQANNTAHYYIPGYPITANSSHGESHGSGGTASTNLTTFWNASNTLGTVQFPTIPGQKVDGSLTFGITSTAFSLGVPLIANLPSQDFGTTDSTTAAPTITDSGTGTGTGTPDVAPLDPTTPIAPAPVPVETHGLTQSALDTLVAAAIGRWEAAGASADQLAVLHSVKITVADMLGDYVGQATPGAILIDSDGAGLGWFVDQTPGDDSEYAVVDGREVAIGGGAQGHVDLLSVLTHELGHQLGLLDLYSAADLTDTMYGYINAGERRVPTSADAAAASGDGQADNGFLIGPTSVAGTLPVGKAINVYYQSTVDAFTTPGANTFSNTATVSGSNVPSVTTTPRTFTVDSLTLGNLVFRDLNNNGVFDAGDTTLNGITVNLYADANNDDVADGAAIATTVTAGGGLYSFAALPAGNFIVGIDVSQAALSGLAASANALDPDNNVDNDNNGVNGQTSIVYSKAITLAYNTEPTPGVGNDTNLTVDFGFVPANVAPSVAAAVTLAYTENAAATVIAPAGTVTDADSPSLNGGNLTVAFTANGVAEDRLSILNQGTNPGQISVSGNTVSYGGATIGTFTGGTNGSTPLVVTFTTAAATPAAVQALLRDIAYADVSETPSTAARSVTFSVTDDKGATGTSPVATINVTAVDDAPVAVADSATTNENTIRNIAVLANDTDVDGGPKAVAFVNGVGLGSSQSTMLASGAFVTLKADGTLDYDPHGAFGFLNAQSSEVDHFTYTLNGGSSTTVAVTVTGVAGGGDNNHGGTGDDTLVGNPSATTAFDISQGGNDSATGGTANDSFFVGAALTGADHIDGGAGNDQVGLQGNYTGANALVLGANTLVNVESLVALAGSSYDITTDNATVAAGQMFTVSAAQLGAGDAFTFNGAAETDGRFTVYGGLGVDTITTGSQNDSIYFGRDGRFGPTDHVDGGAGSDTLALAGSYTTTISGTQVVNIEALTLLDDNGAASYNITLADNWALPGETKTVNFNTLHLGAIVDGSAETNANFIFYGGAGNDTITGGGGNDILYGGPGADTLKGGPGADTYAYTSAAHSTGSAYDTIIGFDPTVDKIDLPSTITITGIDANATGNASMNTLDADLTSALGSLGANHAVQFTATGGLAGHVFEVIDANGVAGYQAGQDMVIEVTGAPAITNTATFI